LIVSLIIGFKEQLSNLINREIRAKIPGGYELQVLQERRYELSNPKNVVRQYKDIIDKQKLVNEIALWDMAGLYKFP
jgi:hypothetical protein